MTLILSACIVCLSDFCFPLYSDQNPFSVTYPIPGNDDTDSAIKYYCNLMEKAIVEGKYCRANLLNLVDASASPGGRLGAIASEEESAHK